MSQAFIQSKTSCGQITNEQKNILSPDDIIVSNKKEETDTDLMVFNGQ